MSTVHEVHVTEEMIKAGIVALCRYDHPSMYSEKDTVAKIYEAMETARVTSQDG